MRRSMKAQGVVTRPCQQRFGLPRGNQASWLPLLAKVLATSGERWQPLPTWYTTWHLGIRRALPSAVARGARFVTGSRRHGPSAGAGGVLSRWLALQPGAGTRKRRGGTKYIKFQVQQSFHSAAPYNAAMLAGVHSADPPGRHGLLFEPLGALVHPLKAVHQPCPGQRTAWLHVPVVVADGAEGQGARQFLGAHGVPHVLLIGKHQDGRAGQVLVL